ncbi:MAG: hypothetical protein GDA50_05555 [Alphaproteobacteria bacterium GM202ARS2]|nr:hypothetical protein [Alphaproteobacteria bacterium GM202ARS2]
MTTAQEHHHVACPYCGFGCDDLSIGIRGGSVDVSQIECPKARAGFDVDDKPSEPRVDGKPVSYEQAIDVASTLLRKAQRPLISGLQADMSAVKRALALAERTGGVLDHSKGDGYSVQVRVIQEKGWFAATRSEVTNRSDVIVLLGTQAVNAAPRFFEQSAWPAQSFLPDNLKNRQIIFVGDEWSSNLGTSPQGKKVQHIKVAKKDMPLAVGALRLLWEGRTVPETTAKTLPLDQLRALTDTLKKSLYGVIVWETAAFIDAYGIDEAEVLVHALGQMTQQASDTHRIVGFPLGGDGNIVGAGQIALWQSGFPLRIAYQKDGRPYHDSRAYDGKKLLADGDVDALLWLTLFDAKDSPPACKKDTPSIVIGRKDLEMPYEPSVYIPVSIPGLDHAGVIVRLDNVVSLPLKALRTNDMPTACDILDLLTQKL